ncbi:PGF-CTERM protein [Halorientalis persicus]|jgi:PGF-CTERM protein|uniref:PGF-CTERM protein n=1 Tax=Halorientalis persicus TaxID=1367881 RepID=A0A1H8FE26_9EURY|nr:hypothetical protein [Halorientalis persicus]SEN29744.1 PGF-CTERM protein [Halorientalis persicus]
MGRRRVLVFCLLSVIALGVGVAGPATAEAADAPAANVSMGTAQDGGTLQLTKRLHLTPDRPGEIEVTARFDDPDNLVELETELPARATVIETDGFAASDGRYAWDGRTDAPSLTYRLSVNETRDTEGPLAGRGDYTFVDAGPWALVRTPQVGVSWSWRGENVTLDRRTRIDGEGVASEAMAFLGPHAEYTRRAHGQRFRLIVPAAATLAEPRSDIFESVTAASGAMRVGDRDGSVLMIAAPTTAVEWSVQGLQTGGNSFWVLDNKRLDVPDNVWLHEYVHTRQAYDRNDGTRWFTEASATYYAALLSLEQDRIGFRAFSTRLEAGNTRSDPGEILADPATWSGRTPYLKGALVAGELDRQIRLATDGRTLQRVFQRMNAADDSLTAAAVQSIVADVADAEVGRFADRYTTTDAVPSMWTRTEHLRAFEGAAPRIEYALAPAADRYRVDGPYRNGSLDAGQPVELATGERLSLDVIVRNTGDASGEFDTVFAVDDRRRDGRSGSIDPGEQRRLTFAHTFDGPGTYTLTVGTRSVTVTVEGPSPPAVVDLQANASRLTAGDALELTARVRNDAVIPAAGTLTLYRNDTVVSTREVVVQPGGERDVAFVTAPAAGVHRFRLGNATATVTVDAPPTEQAGTATGTAADGAGFGVLVAVLAVIAGGLVARRRSR